MSGKQILETERLRLSEFTAADAEFHYELNADPEVVRYTGDPAFESVDAARIFLDAYDAYETSGYGRWNVFRKEDGEFLGWCGLKYHPQEDYVDLGFRLRRKFWGKGYATEASRGCIAWAKQHGISRLAGRVMEDNKASIRVLEKLGFSNWQAYSGDAHCGMISWLELEPFDR